MTPKRRAIVGGLGVAASAALIIVLLVRRGHGHEPGFVDAFRAVDRDAAIIVWRANGGEKSRSWISRVDGRGGATWVQPIPELAMTIGGGGGLTIVDGAAVVRYGHVDASGYDRIDSAAIAFDVADGHVLWDRVLSPYTSHPIESMPGRTSRLETLPLYVSDLAVGKELVSVADTGTGNVVTSTVARTGAVAWTHPITDVRDRPIVFGESVALHRHQGEVELIDAATGEVRSRRVMGTGCALGAEYLAIERKDDAVRLVAYASAKSEPRVVAAAFDAFEGHPTVLRCGTYGDRLVFLVASPYTADDSQTIQVVITDRAGKLLHRIPLAYGAGIMEDTLRLDPLHAPLGGELPRFVPFPEDAMGAGDASSVMTLVMLDLETGTVAWRGKPDPELLHGGLFRAGTWWIWSDGELGPTLAIFDGTTGKLAAAVTAQSHRGVLGVSHASPTIATPDTLWIFSGDWAPPDEAPIAIIDLATGAPRFSRTVAITDATASVKAKLGL